MPVGSSARMSFGFAMIARFVREIENVFGNALVKAFEPRNDVLDVIADAIVIRDQLSPINGGAFTQGRLRDARNNRGFAA